MAIPGIWRNRGAVAPLDRAHLISGGRGSGPAVIWSRDGLVVTNAHVVRGSRVQVQLWDGREFAARVQARDPRRDLAQLRIEATDLPAGSSGDSSQLRPGELAIAIGNPMGFVGALATGVIHAVGPLRGLGRRPGYRPTCASRRKFRRPLANAHGHVIGINTMVAGRLALAIPSNAVRDFLSAGPASTWLGVTLHAHVCFRNPRARKKNFRI